MPNFEFESATYQYKKNHQMAIETGIEDEVNSHIHFVFVLSQSYPLEYGSKLLGFPNFSMTEAYEEVRNGYQLVKFGFFKNAFKSLRSTFEMGILSSYWAVIGNEESSYMDWLKAITDTPFFGKIIKPKLMGYQNIMKFNALFPIDELFKPVSDLHNFVHTKGLKHSTFNQIVKSNEKVISSWVNYMKLVIKGITTLHLLKFPMASIHYDYLKKFGTYSNTPLSGGLFGNYQDYLINLLGEEELKAIQKIAHEDPNVIEHLNWLDSLPDLSEDEIRNIKNEEQNKWS